MRPLKALAAALAAWLCLLMCGAVVGLGINQSMPQRSVSASFSGDDNDQIAWNYLKEKGFSDEAAAGIIGNWKWESAGGGPIEPTACEDGGRYDEYPERYVDVYNIGYG
ncbi:phage tail tip lysozyme, partial [Senegalimassilia anaerobia]|uniref:phage tail tip lysozyme n=1 Tax=Senegalimassilia anaerobia TaxID=1473216 RepID=UPI0026EFAE02